MERQLSSRSSRRVSVYLVICCSHFYAFVCVHVVCGSLILGAAATVNALTGMSIIACNFLLPIGIGVYVIAGGLRATFICDFIHTTILFVIIYVFIFTAYGTSDVLGSPGKMWDLLQQAAITDPVSGNTAGSYTTMRLNSGVVFAACTIAAGFSGVFCDQGYWQRAIASRPESTTRAYMLGALSWFSIPWAFGTVMGLGARALSTNPKFPTYPYALSAAQQSAGLAAPAAAVTMLGKGGAVAVLLVTFMAATSAASAELIAISSIIVYDILGTYWKPLSGKQIIYYSHLIIALWAIWMGAWATILNQAGIDLGWLFYIQGVALTPAVVPIGLTVCWKRLSATAAFWGTLFGTVCGMLGWMIGCWKIYGLINVTNLALPYSAISGSAPGLIMSTLATLLLTWIFPDNYDWEGTRAIAAIAVNSQESSVDEKEELGDAEKDMTKDSVVEVDSESPAPPDHAELQRVFKRAGWLSLALTFVVTILIPMPMFGQDYIFSRKFFTGWVAVSIIWVLAAGAFCVVLPIWESRTQIRLIVSGLAGMRKDESKV